MTERNDHIHQLSKEFLLHDVLASRDVQTISQNERNSVVLTYNGNMFVRCNDNELNPCTSMPIGQDGDWVVVDIPATSHKMNMLGKNWDGRYKNMELALQAQSLSIGFDYNLAVLINSDGKKEPTTSTRPEGYALFMDAWSYSNLAKQMLEELADPAKGKYLLPGYYPDKSTYTAQFKKGNESAQMVQRIIRNARLSADDLSDVREIAQKNENYEFLAMVPQPPGLENAPAEAVQQATTPVPAPKAEYIIRTADDDYSRAMIHIISSAPEMYTPEAWEKRFGQRDVLVAHEAGSTGQQLKKMPFNREGDRERVFFTADTFHPEMKRQSGDGIAPHELRAALGKKFGINTVRVTMLRFVLEPGKELNHTLAVVMHPDELRSLGRQALEILSDPNKVKHLFGITKREYRLQISHPDSPLRQRVEAIHRNAGFGKGDTDIARIMNGAAVLNNMEFAALMRDLNRGAQLSGAAQGFSQRHEQRDNGSQRGV
ncbi:MAG: hypothetical protein AB7L92_01680 [Alphaproteobacteria bacterium]